MWRRPTRLRSLPGILDPLGPRKPIYRTPGSMFYSQKVTSTPDGRLCPVAQVNPACKWQRKSGLLLRIAIWGAGNHASAKKMLVFLTASSDSKSHTPQPRKCFFHSSSCRYWLCFHVFVSFGLNPLCSSCCCFYEGEGVSQFPCQGFNGSGGQEWEVDPSHQKSRILVWAQVIWKLLPPRISIYLYLPCMIKYSCQDILPCTMRIFNVTSLERLCCRCSQCPAAFWNEFCICQLSSFPLVDVRLVPDIHMIIPFTETNFFTHKHKKKPSLYCLIRQRL